MIWGQCCVDVLMERAATAYNGHAVVVDVSLLVKLFLELRVLTSRHDTTRVKVGLVHGRNHCDRCRTETGFMLFARYLM